MKTNYFKMIVVAIAAMVMIGCNGFNDFEAGMEGVQKNNHGLNWDNITKKVIDEYGILRDYIVIFVEGNDLGYIVSNDTMYVTYPGAQTDTITETIYKVVHDTITNTEILIVHDTITNIVEHGYVVVVDYGTENSYIVISGVPNDTIMITFKNDPAQVEEKYNLTVNPNYNNAEFTSADNTSYVVNNVTDLQGVNNRHGEITNESDTLWITSANNVTASATRQLATRKAPAGSRGNLNVAKDSCVYSFNYAGAEYKMNIAAESLSGTGSDGGKKDLLYLAPQTATVEINNLVDTNDTIHHEGRICYKVRQLVTTTYTSTYMPEQGIARTHNDVVTADNATNAEMPVVYLIGDSIPVPPSIIPDTTGYDFPDGEKAQAAQVSVTPYSVSQILVEAILIHTTSDVYLVVDNQYIGSFPCTDHNLYNSAYLVNGAWVPAYLSRQGNGCVWYNQNGGTMLGSMTDQQINMLISKGRAHVSTNYAGNFVRNMDIVNAGKTTGFSIDGVMRFIADSTSVTH